jgi:ubiquinone/menaquinone biosynthesis C-methylase UbiE
LALAAQRVPNASFLKADMTTLDLSQDSFDAVTAFYSFNHIPLAEQQPLLASIARWLRPGGLLLASFGRGGSAGDVEPWLGVPMFFASHDPAANRRHLAEAGFTPLVDEMVSMESRVGPETFQWVLARREQERS